MKTSINFELIKHPHHNRQQEILGYIWLYQFRIARFSNHSIHLLRIWFDLLVTLVGLDREQTD